MENEYDNPEGTDTVQPDQSDTIPDYVYHDPDEDNEENVDPEMTDDDGTVETEDDPEAAEAESEDETEEGEEEEVEYLDMPDGTKLERDEVVQGYLRQSDYTRKSTEVANYRKSLEADTHRMQGIAEAFIEHLSKMIPAAPDPSLALEDPNAYTKQKAQHEAATVQVQQLVQIGEQAKDVSNNISEADHQKLISEENQKLIGMFPETAKQKGREAFFRGAGDAAKELGFTVEELGQATDHRLFALAHWAAKGMQAEKARKTAKAKAAKAPPSAPNKPSNPQAGSRRNAEAMRKLSKSGSMRDAMAIDFD